jgi:hypothetical protein
MLRMDIAAPPSIGAPIPAALTVPGGAGCSASTLFQPVAAPGQTVLTVGAGGQFQTIAAAIAAAANGDLILVQAGTYTNDFADIDKQVTIAGAGGMVNMVATEALPNEKGFFIVDNTVQIDNFVFTGATISDSDGGNGAGIRYQGGAMVLHNDAFIGNQDGILAAAVDGLAVNTVTLQGCTFDDNGNATGPNAGYTHDCYISTGVTSLIASNNIFERANVGHELKSRAVTNLITNNIFYDGPTGTASYDIDLPNGGADTISGNIIEKGPDAQNDAMIHYGGESIPYAGSTLSVTGNRFINDLGSQTTGVLNQTTLQASITGNEFDNFETATIGAGLYTASGNVDENGHAIAPSSSQTFAPGTDVDDFSRDTNSHTLVLTDSTGVLGGAGLLSITATWGHETVVGGAGGLRYQEQTGSGGSFISTSAGASDTISVQGQDVIDSAGHDTIAGGAGNLTIQVDGQASIASGSGSNAYAVNGQALIAGNGGSDTVQVNNSAAKAFVTGAEAYLQMTVSGGTGGYNIQQGGSTEQATVTGGASTTRIYQGTVNVTTAGGGPGASIAFGAGTVTLFSAGQDTIHAGTGQETVIVSGSSAIYGGSGALSVYGRSEGGMASVYGAGGSVYIGGDTGDILYYGGKTANTVTAALSNVTLHGGAGQMDVVGGSRQSVSGGSGGLIFTTSGGADVITTTAGAHDTIMVQDASTIISNGRDLISAGTGNSAITANGTATINGSTGNAFYTLNGTDILNGYGYSRATVGAGSHDTVTNYGGAAAVAVLAGGTLVFSQLANADHETATVSGAGATLVSNAGATLTSISVTGAGDAATLGGGQMNLFASASGAQIIAGSGADTITLVQGGDVVHAGSGTVTLGLYDWADPMATTVYGGSGLLTEGMGSGNLVFVGGSGNAVLAGTYGAETVTAGAGNITLNGGNAGTNFVAGLGHATVQLSPGGGAVTFGGGAASITEASYGAADIYTFTAGQGGGSDTITGFRAGTDTLVFQGVSVAGSTTAGGVTSMILSDGTHLTLSGAMHG